MRRYIFAVALLSGSASADMEARQGADIVRLTQSPCHPAVLAVIPEGHRGPFRLALVTLAGETHHACHALRVDGLVMFVFDDGSSALVPVALFKPAHDI